MHVGILEYVTDYSLDVASLAQQVEQLGFESLWLPEHPVIPVDSKSVFPGPDGLPEYCKHLIDPFVGLAVAAQATRRLKLGTAVCLVAEHNPLILAKTVATLDVASQGRFLFGVGAGWLREESEIFSVDFPRRWTQTREHLAAMKAIWAADAAGYQGRYVRFPAVWSHPKPAQKPHPPFIIGGEREQAPERVAEYGDGWLPRYRFHDARQIEQGRRRIERLMRAKGRDPGTLTVTMLGCAEDRAEHRRFADAGVDRILQLLFCEPRHHARQRLQEIAEAVL